MSCRRWGASAAEQRNFFAVRCLGFLHTRLSIAGPQADKRVLTCEEFPSLRTLRTSAVRTPERPTGSDSAFGNGEPLLAAIPGCQTQDKGTSAEPTPGCALLPGPRIPSPKLSHKLIFGLGGLSPPACLPVCLSCLSPAFPPPLRSPRTHPRRGAAAPSLMPPQRAR